MFYVGEARPVHVLLHRSVRNDGQGSLELIQGGDGLRMFRQSPRIHEEDCLHESVKEGSVHEKLKCWCCTDTEPHPHGNITDEDVQEDSAISFHLLPCCSLYAMFISSLRPFASLLGDGANTEKLRISTSFKDCNHLFRRAGSQPHRYPDFVYPL